MRSDKCKNKGSSTEIPHAKKAAHSALTDAANPPIGKAGPNSATQLHKAASRGGTTHPTRSAQVGGTPSAIHYPRAAISPCPLQQIQHKATSTCAYTSVRTRDTTPDILRKVVGVNPTRSSIRQGTLATTENASRNIPNIGKNVLDTMCALGDIRNNFQHIPDTK